MSDYSKTLLSVQQPADPCRSNRWVIYVPEVLLPFNEMAIIRRVVLSHFVIFGPRKLACLTLGALLQPGGKWLAAKPNCAAAAMKANDMNKAAD